MMRLRIALAVAGIAALAAPALVVASAQAASFRYWSYWTGTADGWEFASRGPAFRPAQESVVEGWRLAVSDVQGTFKPRFDPADLHARACEGTAPQAGRLRIAVVLDFGTTADALAADAPPAPVVACAVVDEGATGFDALMAVSDLRTESGMVCGIDGYPSSGCGREPVDRGSEDAAPQDSAPDPSPAPAQTPKGVTADAAGPSAHSDAPRSSGDSGIGSSQGSGRATATAPPEQAHSTTAVMSSSPVATSTPPASTPAAAATDSAEVDGEGSGGPFVAGLVLIFLVLLTSMGWLRARRRR